MSYLVLARKYRPQRFEDVIGQEHVTRTLQNAIKQGRLHHAFLFTGARGVGKTTAARILAKALSCVEAPTPTPCNACDACREITSGQSVDVQEIDAASNNGVDNIRELRDSIRYAPVRGKKKVYILDEVHMLTSGAWNALLKTLEEPPPHAVFVFATTDPHKLPATILSRVQRYDFKLIPVRRIVEHVAKVLTDENIQYEPAALTLVARESGGSVRDSLSLLDQVIAAVGLEDRTLREETVAEILGVADRALLGKLGRAILARDAEAALSLVDAAFARGSDLVQLTHAILAHLRDLLVAQVVKSPASLASLIEGSTAEIGELVETAKAAPAGLLELLFERLALRAEEIAKAPQPRYMLEVALVELMRVEPLEPMGALIAKLETLEARLERAGVRTSSPSPPPSSSSPPAGPSAPSGTNGGPSARLHPNTATSSTTATSATTATTAPRTELAIPKLRDPGDETAPPPPPTPPGPPPSTAPRDFTALVEGVIAIDPMLSALAQARLLRWPDGPSDRTLSLGFDRTFPADALRERLPSLRAAIKQLMGRDLDVELVVGPSGPLPGTETLIEVEQRKLDEDRERRRREAIEHPARQLLDKTFGGTWKEPVVDLPEGMAGFIGAGLAHSNNQGDEP
jgi:DNA polymerase-3 subunit gamma/tau